ncbi:MAG: hypothetical protein LBK76_11800 [Verrucomicrobiales bacterium]|jgi:hypothetical protein|nr:hypothetical protein [Verrucomicrobiales bacterium]
MNEVWWLLAGVGAVLALYFAWGGARWIYERLRFNPEERWRRRYDRKLKRHFKSM